ncbi:DNA repair protein RecO [Aphanothece hegewaldii CCALA 016]|uniref:DNA repair protein RecO n=1 Tax=Aphanothece hegewaldii CCALA 016 TaxID=2107694 RepID=A0A2T1LW51_9CHRO|nr:DNA repair protein RecO [Aphanothece hegewaldii]PSF36134.1 DNA repair protein RecO [Aphanothece hegewaldii CCALA 016]
MSNTYQATGIILKGMPLGEADRLVTILTSEYGLVRAVVPGARKHKSSLRGRSELFVVNNLLIVKGRSLDKVTQADTVESYPKLSQNLGKLTASQYLAELVLGLALSEQPQTELYQLLREHLRRIETLLDESELLPHLTQAIFHLLVVAGIGPQVQLCCVTRQEIYPNFTDLRWRSGFSLEAGGSIQLTEIPKDSEKNENLAIPKIHARLGAVELTILQHLGKKFLPEWTQLLPENLSKNFLDLAWIKIERLLRDYAEYHLGYSFRSASMIDNLYALDF